MNKVMFSNVRKGEVMVTIKNLQKKVPVNPKRIIKAVLEVLSSEDITKTGEITVLLVDNKQIREVNLKYLGRDCPTDVISFDNSLGKGDILADIVVSTDVAACNAKALKTTPIYELYLYVIHGVLHLLGYDDDNEKNALIMRRKEEYLCSKFFLSRTPNTEHR